MVVINIDRSQRVFTEHYHLPAPHLHITSHLGRLLNRNVAVITGPAHHTAAAAAGCAMASAVAVTWRDRSSKTEIARCPSSGES